MSIADLAGGAPGLDPGDPIERVSYGRVTKPPVASTDPLTVTINDFSGDHSFLVEAGHWAARGTALPILGTRCLVVFDNRDDAWVAVWDGTDIYPAGTTGASGATTFVSGTGAPSSGVGSDGAIYLDRTALELYGPKASGAWPGTPFAKLLPISPTWEELHD